MKKLFDKKYISMNNHFFKQFFFNKYIRKHGTLHVTKREINLVKYFKKCSKYFHDTVYRILYK